MDRKAFDRQRELLIDSMRKEAVSALNAFDHVIKIVENLEKTANDIGIPPIKSYHSKLDMKGFSPTTSLKAVRETLEKFVHSAD